jgi:hypothetical protein
VSGGFLRAVKSALKSAVYRSFKRSGSVVSSFENNHLSPLRKALRKISCANSLHNISSIEKRFHSLSEFLTFLIALSI